MSVITFIEGGAGVFAHCQRKMDLMMISLEAFTPPPEGLTVIILLEHIGDIIACEPVIGHARAMWPDRPLAWLTLPRYVDLLSAHPGLDLVLTTESLERATRWAEDLPENCRALNLHFHQRPCPATGRIVINSNDPRINTSNYLDYGGLLTSFCLSAGLPPLSGPPRFYIDDQVRTNGPDQPYVIFHCRSNSEDRNWDPLKWQGLFDYFADKNITVAEIGLEPVVDRRDHPLYKDLTGQLSLSQIALTIDRADCFLGVDSGFAHLANALNKPGLIIMGLYDRWNDYNPFTGLYAEGHIVRHPRLPARYLSLERVIDRYERLGSPDPNQDENLRSDEGPLIFPNALQKILLKIYRPLAKRGPTADYRLFTGHPRLYFMIPGQDRFAGKAIRAVLKITGGVPPKVYF